MAEQGVIQLFPHKPAPRIPAPAPDHVRAVEAILFASADPVSEADLLLRLPAGTDVASILVELQSFYAGRGVNLVRIAGKWAMRTTPDLAHLMTIEQVEPKRLSRAALETLAIIAYHQPVTRAEVEEVRGVSLGKGTLDLLMEIGWVRVRGRRKTPGRPVAYGTTEAFLSHFGLDRVTDLPGLEELVGAGILDKGALSVAAAERDDPADMDDTDDLDLDPAEDDMDPSEFR